MGVSNRTHEHDCCATATAPHEPAAAQGSITIRKPGSPLDGRRGHLVRDAGLAEHGPDRGRRFWVVVVEGRRYFVHEGEIAGRTRA